MKSTDKHIHLFGPSGCVTESAFFRYLNHELNASEMHAMEGHISECLFCSDAMEGYEKQSDKIAIQSEFASIKSEFKLKQVGAGAFKKKDNKRYLMFAVSIAAILTVIVSGYYLFQILPMSNKTSEMAIQTPPSKEDVPIFQNPEGTKSDVLQEEEALNSTKKVESKLLKEKETISDKAIKYYDNRNGWLESDQDAASISNGLATGKSAEYKPIVKTVTITSQEQKAGDGIAVTEDTEYSGNIDDVTISLDQKDALKQASVTGETKVMVDEIFAVSDVVVEEKVVLGKKGKGKDRNKNEREYEAVTGGVARSTVTPTLNGAITDYNSGHFEQALPQFQYLSEQEKNNYAAVYYYAMCLYNKGEKDSALVQLEKLVKKTNNPFYELALWQKAQIAEEANKKKQAVDIYREIIKNNGSLKTRAINKVDELDK